MAIPMQSALAPSPAPARYPGHLTEHKQLGDGTDLVIRAIRPSDYIIESAFIRGLSQEAGYNRLLSSRRLTRQEIRRLTVIDYEREMAFVGVTGDGDTTRLLGVARYVRDEDAGGAEFAIVVADAWQRKGIGSLLLDALLQYARSAGIGQLHGITLATNQAMYQLARKHGFTLRNDPRDATVRQVQKSLLPAILPAPMTSGLGGRVAANQ